MLASPAPLLACMAQVRDATLHAIADNYGYGKGISLRKLKNGEYRLHVKGGSPCRFKVEDVAAARRRADECRRNGKAVARFVQWVIMGNQTVLAQTAGSSTWACHAAMYNC
jgi:hypothetical protein